MPNHTCSKEKTEQLNFTTRLTRDDVAGLIEAMAESIKEGHVKVQKSGEQLTLEAPRVIDFEVNASRSSERSSLVLEISWRNKPIEVPDCPEE
ncbi:amphi-Trp domain-containing protein [Desulfovibrio litoralis]|uniref:Amphi-Trp domain-containing protein n=1 Tax=Desulfovibrio litoralis DSM 11393 TaxID=1121455 RepID=A0A1M7SY18_9BACT|nr:amphi-Trp domain-containing protein [Desulfovibrio litoralis]SHN63403.1 amphi-Trp domain-containing protein [Desulfovibrio litoralis DSM 11393]